MAEQSITEQGATLPASNVRGRPRSWRVWIYAALFAVVTAAIVGSVALTNYLLNPLRFSGSAMGDVASVLHGGKNYLIYDGNLDWRAFRREYVRRMPAAPDIAVFGGSRWQEATSALVPGSKFANVFVHSDYYEDMLAIAEVMYAADRLPKDDGAEHPLPDVHAERQAQFGHVEGVHARGAQDERPPRPVHAILVYFLRYDEAAQPDLGGGGRCRDPAIVAVAGKPGPDRPQAPSDHGNHRQGRGDTLLASARGPRSPCRRPETIAEPARLPTARGACRWSLRWSTGSGA